MARFEEMQMTIAESVKNYLDIANMQVFIEQFTLDRESKFLVTLPNMQPPYPVSATISFVYDAFQTGITLYEEPFEESSSDVDTSIDLEFSLKLPIMKNFENIGSLMEEIVEDFPDTEPILIVREIIGGAEETFKEYEIHYSYIIDISDALNNDLFDETFEELRDIMELIYRRTKNYIDYTWYGGEE
jgi:hypothetical protein